jgi:predicted enzyme related to lactoylglutathione lyase
MVGAQQRWSVRCCRPVPFRLEAGDLERAVVLYADLFGIEGERHPGARQYFDCGGVTAPIIDVSRGGMIPTPGPKSLYFAVDDIAGIHARASRLGVLAP